MSSTPVSLRTFLALKDLRVQVRLGCEEEERRNPQFVRFDVQIRFPSMPEGCLTDRLKDTICYAELSEKLNGVCEQDYCLIEHLGWKAFSATKELLTPGTLLGLRVIKEKPPIPNLEGGSRFVIEEGDGFSW